MRILDRYLARQFLKIFAVCVLGVPLLFMVVDLTDNLDVYLAEGATRGELALHYLFQFPYQMLLGFPIAALLASVFTISTLTRHFETTAAKAGGISFYRLVMPILLASLGLSLMAGALTELVPVTSRRAEEVLGQQETRSQTLRMLFVFRGNSGRVYKVRRLDRRLGRMTDVQVEREGTGYRYPTYNVTAARARWDTASAHWSLEDGRLRLFPEKGRALTFQFRELWQRSFTESPDELLADPPEENEMRYAELGRYIEAIQRSGGTARKLIVQRDLRLSFPLACFIIVVFGVPLAHSSRRGGTPLSVGIALATTILYLIIVRIAQALGAGGVVAPAWAAWMPNLIFLGAGLGLMAKVRT
ncbi:MAG: LptF/LptG family permease [Gemmatimonadota bacterium]